MNQFFFAFSLGGRAARGMAGFEGGGREEKKTPKVFQGAKTIESPTLPLKNLCDLRFTEK